MDSKKAYPILGLIVIALAAGGYWYLTSQTDNTYKVIFKIGKEDSRSTEFRKSGLEAENQ